MGVFHLYFSLVRIENDSIFSYVATSTSVNLKDWTEPRILTERDQNLDYSSPGNVIRFGGRMIDPYLIEDKDEPGKWWCFYKQNGVSNSWSRDLVNWTFDKNIQGGENVCVLRDGDGSLITLGQSEWEWAAGRLTAGFVLDCRSIPSVGKYIMFFHGSGPLTETEGYFDKNSSIGIAWSDDLQSWAWPD